MSKLLPLPPACDLYRLLIPFLLSLTISFNVHATPSQKGGPVTYSGKDVKLREVFKEIKKQTGYSLMYSNKKVPLNLDERTSVEFNKTSIQDVMEFLLKGKNLQWQLDDESILIFLKPILPDGKQIQGDTSIISSLSGKITDALGKPIEGATISIKGTQKGTVSSADGTFLLTNVELGSTLLVSNVGYETREIPARGKSLLVKLNVVVQSLDETIIIGYGTTTQRFSTGNVSTVKAKDIEKQPVTNPLLAIQGRVPGLFITQNTGVANGAVTVRIQGQNSIRPEGNEPLIVVDGIPYPSIFKYTGGGGPLTGATPASDGTPLSFINPAEIESIDVLKDADATAIYGSRGANGVILITTKKGKPGKMKLSIDLQQGWGEVPKKVKMLDTRQYLDMRYEAFTNDDIDWRDPSVRANDLKEWDTTRYTDWQETLLGGTAKYTNINTSVSGGTDAMQYLIGATYNQTTTVFPGDFDDKRGSVHFSVNGASPNRKFRVQLSGSYMIDENRLPQIDLTERAIRLEPIAPPLYNSDGSLNWELNSSGSATWENPLAWSRYMKYENNTKNLISNAKLSYLVLPGLEVLSSFGYNYLRSDAFQAVPSEGMRPQDRATTPRSATYINKNISSWIVEPQIAYKKTLNTSKIDGLLGVTVQHNKTDLLALVGSGYASDILLKNIGAATDIITVPSNAIYKYNALFGRFNYNLNDKYIVNLTARRDGSSRFGEKTKFHNFGSIGAAWIFSQEELIQNNIRFLSFGKIRGSFGTTGNDQIGDYTYLNLYYNTFVGIPYQGVIGLDPSSLPNPYIQWEETKKWQMGIDLGFFKDRIIVNGTYSINRSSNQILDYTLPSVSGFPSIKSNFPATVQNTSWEISLNSTNLKTKDFFWTSNVNITIPRNKVTKFPNIETTPYAMGLNGVIVGQPLGVQKVLHYIGVDPATGLYVVADKDGKPVVDIPAYPDDLTVLINTLPRFYGGFQNTISWKTFQLDFLFQFVKQLDAKSLFYDNDSRAPGRFGQSASNQPITVLNRWQKPGDNSTHARYTSRSMDVWPTVSDAGYSFEASYVRLKNISLSWRLPTNLLQKMALQNGQLYIVGQNLATITNYTGIDPETKSSAILPPLRIITVGLRIEL